jgi:DNA-binding NtrC family response regulator
VDDHPAILRSLERVLAQRGRVAQTADSASAAKARLLAPPGRPRLAGVLLDWKLAAGDTGESVLGWLDIAFPLTPIFVLSGAEPRELPLAALQARFIHFEEKPLRPERLDHILREHFDPWDRHVIEARRFLLALAGDNEADLTEHRLRTMDPYLESVPERALGRARGISDRSARTYRHELRSIFGVRALDEVRTRWEVASYGRGVRRPGILPLKRD